MTQERSVDAIVRNIWGNWDKFHAATERLMDVARANNGEVGGRQFKKELMGNLQLSQEEYRLAMQAIDRMIKDIREQERERKEEMEEVKDFELKEADKKRTEGREQTYEENERNLRDDHSHYFSIK
jgi:hypothetical protein